QAFPEESDTGRSDENPPSNTATCFLVMPPPSPRHKGFPTPEHESPAAEAQAPKVLFAADTSNDSNQETSDPQRIRGLIRWQGLIERGPKSAIHYDILDSLDSTAPTPRRGPPGIEA